MSTGPHDYSEFVEPNTEVIQQEVTTYLKKDNAIYKRVVTRNFFGDDYVDGVTSEVLYVIE